MTVSKPVFLGYISIYNPFFTNTWFHLHSTCNRCEGIFTTAATARNGANNLLGRMNNPHPYETVKKCPNTI